MGYKGKGGDCEEEILRLLANVSALREGDTVDVSYVRIRSLGGGLFRLEINREAVIGTSIEACAGCEEEG